jgi:hypothetical protein
VVLGSFKAPSRKILERRSRYLVLRKRSRPPKGVTILARNESIIFNQQPPLAATPLTWLSILDELTRGDRIRVSTRGAAPPSKELVHLNAPLVTRGIVHETQWPTPAREPKFDLPGHLGTISNGHHIENRLPLSTGDFFSSYKHAIDNRSLNIEKFTLLLKGYAMFDPINNKSDVSVIWPARLLHRF